MRSRNKNKGELTVNPFETVLTEHAKKYPKLLPRDIVKLALQSEYGNAHMVRDEAEALAKLKEEMSLCTVSENEELFENIGDKYVRLNLKSHLSREISPELINKMFMISAKEEHSDDSYAFESKLFTALSMASRGHFAFPESEMREYLEYYMKRHMGEAMSHSTLYRETYCPAYRVICSHWVKLLPIITAVYNKMQTSDRIIIAIDGMAASGKSTAAKHLSALFDAPIIHTDQFFLPPEMRTRERMDEPGGNLHRERFFNEVASKLRENKDFEYGIFDCSANTVTAQAKIPASKVVIVEGSYSLHPYYGDYCDIKVCMTISAERQSHRIMRRNGAIMHKRFVTEWIPLENKYLKHFDIEKKCDFLLDTK